MREKKTTHKTRQEYYSTGYRSGYRIDGGRRVKKDIGEGPSPPQGSQSRAEGSRLNVQSMHLNVDPSTGLRSWFGTGEEPKERERWL